MMTFVVSLMVLDLCVVWFVLCQLVHEVHSFSSMHWLLLRSGDADYLACLFENRKHTTDWQKPREARVNNYVCV